MPDEFTKTDNEETKNDVVNDEDKHKDERDEDKNDNKDNKDNVKTFTQDEVDQFVKDRLAREQTKWEKKLEAEVDAKLKEKQRLSELSEEELANERLTEREKQLEEREKAIRHKEMIGDAEQALRERHLPSTFAGFLLADDENSTMDNIKEFQSAFNEAVKEAVKKELSGKTPSTNKNKNKTWTREEINKVKDPMKRQELIRKHADLFKR